MTKTKPTMLNYREAAQLLNVALGTLYSWVHRNQIPHIRISARLVRFDSEELCAWLEARRVRVESGGEQ